MTGTRILSHFAFIYYNVVTHPYFWRAMMSLIHSATGLRGDFVHVLSGPLKDASAKQTIGEDVHVA